MDVKSKIPGLQNFPEEVTAGGVKIYGEKSLRDHLAVLTHFLNGSYSVNESNRAEIAESLASFIIDSDVDAGVKASVSTAYEWNGDDIEKVAESCMQYGLFDDFFTVPFPEPKSYSHTFIDLFAGMGGIRLPFSELGYKCVFSSEWDAHAQQTYLANFGEMPFGDITKIDAACIPPHDILLAGFPCQAFSIMGKGLGFADTRGTMFFEIERILKHHKPKVILLENVKRLVSHDGGNTFRVILERLDALGYHVKWKVLNALDFGLPQKRERVIMVGFTDKACHDRFSFDFTKKEYSLADVLEPDDAIDRKLFASDMIVKKRMERVDGKELFYPSVWHENKAGNISVLPYACALRTGASYNYLLVNGIRRPSSRELLRFQGFPDKYEIAVSHGEIRRQTGNSVAVPMIRAVAQRINEIISEQVCL